MMWAVTFSRFGDAPVLTYDEVPDPIPGPGEVLVRVRACGVNHLDLDIRAGRSRYPIEFPHILGREAAGEVYKVGPDVAARDLTERVLVRSYYTCWRCKYCLAGQDNHCINARLPGLHAWGGYAELIVAPARELIPLPEGLGFIDAAASQIAFGTAWHALVDLGRIQAGMTILILGAGGGVGTASVQVASLCGARVFAATHRPENEQLLRSLGAEVLVAQTAPEMVDVLQNLLQGDDLDLVLDPLGGDFTLAALALIAPGGRLVSCGAHLGETIRLDLVGLFRNQTHLIGSRRALRSNLDQVLPLLTSGQLRPIIDQAASLSKAVSVHQRMEAARHTGKQVLIPET